MAEIVTGKTIPSGSAFYYIVGTLIVILTAAIAFGGIKKVSRWTDMMVPVMAVLYMVVVLLLIILNFTRIPYFFGSVFADPLSRMHFLEVFLERFLHLSLIHI